MDEVGKILIKNLEALIQPGLVELSPAWVTKRAPSRFSSPSLKFSGPHSRAARKTNRAHVITGTTPHLVRPVQLNGPTRAGGERATSLTKCLHPPSRPSRAESGACLAHHPSGPPSHKSSQPSIRSPGGRYIDKDRSQPRSRFSMSTQKKLNECSNL